MMSGFREDSMSFLIYQRSRPLATMFLRGQVCSICFVVGYRGNIPAKLYSILTIGSRGYVKIFPINVYKGNQSGLVSYFDGLSLLL